MTAARERLSKREALDVLEHVLKTIPGLTPVGAGWAAKVARYALGMLRHDPEPPAIFPRAQADAVAGLVVDELERLKVPLRDPTLAPPAQRHAAPARSVNYVRLPALERADRLAAEAAGELAPVAGIHRQRGARPPTPPAAA